MTRHNTNHADGEATTARGGRDGNHSVQTTVITAVAASEGVDPLALEETLQDVVDADALDALVAHSGSEWQLSFEFAGHEVTVDGEGAVAVDGTPSSAGPPRDAPARHSSPSSL